MNFADGKTVDANVPHLNVWGFDISAAEFPQPKQTRVFGVNRPLGPLGAIQTKDARFSRRVLFVPEQSHTKQKNAGLRRYTSTVIGLYVIMC